MPSRDFTDSESDHGEPIPRKPSSSKSNHQRQSSAASQRKASGSTSGNKDTPNPHPLRVTLRPTLNHLVDNPAPKASTSNPTLPPSDRSSLSPPPPITLKLGLASSHTAMSSSHKTTGSNASRSSIAERAAYSSSEGEGEGDRGTPQPSISIQPKSKSKKTKKSSHLSPNLGNNASSSTPPQTSSPKRKLQPAPSGSGSGSGSSNHLSTTNNNNSVPSAHRKSYDWLQPGFAGASHHGPEGRNASSDGGMEIDSKNIPRITGWSPADDLLRTEVDNIGGGSPILPQGSGDGQMTPAPEVPKPKKSSKRKPDATSGSGTGSSSKSQPKKIAKKNVPMPWKDNSMFYDGSTPLSLTPSQSRPMSTEVTPEPEETRNAPIVVPRGVSPPFVLADAKQLGFPVFPKPIVAPEVILGTFPKTFAPINGNDPKFLRKEKTRIWKLNERVIAGVGGGQMKIKTWQPGPPSELSILVQADRDAQELKKQNKLAKPGPGPGPTNSSSTAGATPTGIGARSPHLSPLSGTIDNGISRPSLKHSFSTDSLITAGAEILGDEISEIGDDESVLGGGNLIGDEKSQISISTSMGSPVPPSKSKHSKKNAKPRKSKLANELVPEE